MLNIYFYTGYSKNGRAKLGIKKGTDREEIRKNLKNSGIFPEKILKIPFLSKKAGTEDIINLFTESRMFIKNGYSFFKITEILEENPNLKIYTDRMKISMKEGKSIYEIFKNSGLPLKNTDFMIIKSGEESGNIYRAFENIEKRIKENDRRKREVKRIMTYPAVVAAAVVFLVLFLGGFILPDFIKIIETNKKELPLITRGIIWYTENFLYITAGILFFIFSAVIFFKKENNRERFFDFLLKIKFVKNITDTVFIITFAEILSMLLNSGITITESIHLIKDETRHKYFAEKLEIAENDLRKGNTVYAVFKNMGIFSKLETELIQAGEEAGELVEVLELISQRKNENFRQQTDMWIKFLEPVLIIIMGIIIGTVFLGIYMPIFQMMEEI